MGRYVGTGKSVKCVFENPRISVLKMSMRTENGSTAAVAGGGGVGNGGRLPQLGGVTQQDRQRKIAVKCLELEEMLERQG